MSSVIHKKSSIVNMPCWLHLVCILILSLQLNRDDAEILYVVGEGGWHDELLGIVTPSSTPSSASSRFHRNGGGIPLTRLRQHDCLALRSARDCVGPPCTLASFATQFKYSPSMQMKTFRLSKAYSGWRPIRGDGNCYYR